MDISEDVVTVILVRLPVKSLLRFRCVCKAWCGLIGSRHFIDMHLRQERRGNEYLVVKRFETMEEDTRLSFYHRGNGDLHQTAPDLKVFPPGTKFIIGPCNGICLIGENLFRDTLWDGTDGHFDWESNPLYLCNPATHQLRRIPDRPFGNQRARPKEKHGLKYNCKRLSVGFGYDSRTNDYKVVSIIHFLRDKYYSQARPSGPLKIEIYNLNSNSWRVADTLFPKADINHRRPDVNPYPDGLDFEDDVGIRIIADSPYGVFFNGCIHWNARVTTVILAFKISDEVMQAIKIPRAISPLDNFLGNHVMVLEDLLAFVQAKWENNSNTSIIWVMMNYGDEESWVKRFSFKPQIDVHILTFWGNTVICETRDGDLASGYLQKKKSVAAIEQFRRHRHIKRCVLPIDVRHPYRNLMDVIVMHKESLVPLR